MRRIVSVLGAVAMVGGAGALGAEPAAAAAPGATTTYVTIPGDGGTPLKAFLIKPTGRGAGPFPLLVMPSSWSLLDVEYVGAAVKLARTYGFEVVSYTSRGFWDSGGEIEVAGRADTNDASRVIDWAVRTQRADARRIGMAGISYGAGISLLTAARDRRVRAVAAMSAWADLKASLYPGQTVNEQSAAGLLLAGNATGRPGKDLRRLQKAYLADDIDAVLPLAAGRGAATYVGAINRNGTAVLIGNAWQDGIFPPGQIVDFYNRLTGPKRLMLEAGDHGTVDGPGAVGLPNDVWAASGRWFDHFLRGTRNGIDTEQPVQVRPSNGGGRKGYPSWRALGPGTLTYYLRDGRMATGKGAAAPVRITTGRSTVADSGIVEVTGTARQFGLPWKITVAQVDRGNGAVWSGPAFGRTTSIGGFPVLRTTVTPSAKNTSLFAYLYDVGPDGVGALITHQAYSLRGAAPGRARRLTLRLEPNRWTVAKGHHLALVADTMDIRYRSLSRTGGTVTFTSPKSAPSSLGLPIG